MQDDTIEIKAQKSWANITSEAAQDYAISSITLQVKLGETVVQSQEVIAPDWKHTFTGLKKYDKAGKKLVYTVDEVVTNEADADKLAAYDKTVETAEDGTIVVTNTFNPEKVQDDTTEITVTKIWEDNLDKYTTRPNNVTLTVNGTNYTFSGAKNVDRWTYTIKNLPKYDVQGNRIVYTATELDANIPTGYTRVSQEGLTVTNRANVIVEKTAHKANEDGTIGNVATSSDVFKANETVYYKLTFKNAGDSVVDTKTLTDILPLRLNLVAINDTVITENITSGTDSNGYTWTITENETGNTVINWTLTNVAGGAEKELIIKAQVEAEAEYKDLCQKTGDTTAFTAQLFVRKDGKVPYEGSGTGYDKEVYTSSLGTVYLTSSDIFYDIEANLKNDDLYYLIRNNNKITEKVSKGITRAELEDALANNGITLASDEVVVWYVIKNEDDGYHIDGVIRKISELTSISNSVYMDNIKQDETTIDLEDIEIGQRGTVTVNVTSTTTATVSTPMDVVFVIDVSGSMQGRNATNMVNAVNNSIKTLMSKNSENRIGIAIFSDNASELVPLGKYSTTSNYLELNKDKDRITEQVTGKSKRANISGGTYTQSGIKLGAEMLTDPDLDTTFTTTVNGKTITGTRTPVLILITDGEPTYYAESADATTTRKGTGFAGSSTPTHYYWTIRTAKYYKDAVSQKYYSETTKQAKMFTIGIGMDGTLATTMLNPNRTNVDQCNDGSSGYRISEKMRLYNLLNKEGTPYAYDYADGTKSGALTESDIENFLTSSLESSSESMVVRAITAEESKARRVDLTNIDTTKAFSLEIIGDTTLTYSSLSAAQTDGYVKIDSNTNTYYVDLTNISRETTVNINYWEK